MKRVHPDTDELETAKIDTIINMFDTHPLNFLISNV